MDEIDLLRIDVSVCFYLDLLTCFGLLGGLASQQAHYFVAKPFTNNFKQLEQAYAFNVLVLRLEVAVFQALVEVGTRAVAKEEADFYLNDLLMLWTFDVNIDDDDGLGVVDLVMVRLTGVSAAKLD